MPDFQFVRKQGTNIIIEAFDEQAALEEFNMLCKDGNSPLNGFSYDDVEEIIEMKEEIR